MKTSKADGKEVLSWCLYDFANSAFATTILAVIFSRYYAGVVAGGSVGVDITFFGKIHNVHGTALFNFVVTIAMFLVAITSPILGAWADSLSAKKKFLFAYIILGVVSTSMLATVGPGEWVWGAVWFILANFAFAGGNVFYNAFLRDIASTEEMGRISGWGWGIGYLGGGLLLIINLIMLQAPQVFGFPEGFFTVHHCFASVAIWWLLFSIPLLKNVKDQTSSTSLTLFEGAKDSFVRLGRSLREIKQHKQLWRFLIAYIFFNDGVETVILLASIFGNQELGMSQELLIIFFLIIQFTAFLGSILFGKLTLHISTKHALLITLFIWCFVVTWAYFIGWTGFAVREYFIMGIVAGTVMGASQSLARAMQGTFTPKGREAEYYGFFSVSGRFAAILGPLTYGAVVAITDSLRNGILFLSLFFIIGIIILFTVDEDKGKKEAFGL